MQILLSCAKDMTPVNDLVSDICSIPLFEEIAMENASLMAQYSPEELGKMLKVSPSIAMENFRRYQEFGISATAKGQAAFAYTGMAYRHLKPGLWTEDDASYANNHLWITSFLYGLLRPMDMINLYRLEGSVKLRNGKSMFDFWKPELTEAILKYIRQDDGILVHLATEEMTRLFDWKKICNEATVIEPRFLAKNGDITKVITVHAKMCRGAMASHIIRHRITDTNDLKSFEYDGYRFSHDEGNALIFIKD